MKRTIILLSLFLLATTLSAQNKMFGDYYLKLHKPTQEEGIFKKLNDKEIRKFLATSETDDSELHQKEKALFENANKMIFALDFAEEKLPSTSQINTLLQPYEELVSMKTDEMAMEVRGLMKEDKVKELIVLTQMDDEAVFFVNISFKKPISLGDYMDNPGNISQLFSFNLPEEEKNKALFQFNFSKNSNFSKDDISELVAHSSELQVIKEDNLYGVVKANKKDHRYIIRPHYNKELILYGVNPGNTYIKASENNTERYLLYDKFGFIIAWGEDISPVYAPGSKEIAFFILNSENRYLLYECPERYELWQDGSSWRPHIGYRLSNCKSIKLKDENTLECVKEDGSVELITIMSL